MYKGIEVQYTDSVTLIGLLLQLMSIIGLAKDGASDKSECWSN
jgi:hypothetical protein